MTTPVSPAVVAFTRHAERRALERHLDLQDLGELLLSHHDQRRRNRGQADWLVRTRGIAQSPTTGPTATTRPLPSSSAHGASSLRSQDRVRELLHGRGRHRLHPGPIAARVRTLGGARVGTPRLRRRHRRTRRARSVVGIEGPPPGARRSAPTPRRSGHDDRTSAGLSVPNQWADLPHAGARSGQVVLRALRLLGSATARTPVAGVAAARVSTGPSVGRVVASHSIARVERVAAGVAE